jgi:predicted nucleic acid-binding protein
MIAAIASAQGLPLHTRNAKNFAGLGDMLQIVEV